MPIYEYLCQSCGRGLEAIQRFNDAPLTECPACKKPSLKKMVSAAAFQLKGSGWYATDFKNKSKNTKKDTPASGGDSGGDTDSGKDIKTDAAAAGGCGGGACGCH